MDAVVNYLFYHGLNEEVIDGLIHEFVCLHSEIAEDPQVRLACEVLKDYVRIRDGQSD